MISIWLLLYYPCLDVVDDYFLELFHRLCLHVIFLDELFDLVFEEVLAIPEIIVSNLVYVVGAYLLHY